MARGYCQVLDHRPNSRLPRILPFLSFSNKHIVSNLEELVGKFSSHDENALSAGWRHSAADLGHSEICVSLGRRLTIP